MHELLRVQADLSQLKALRKFQQQVSLDDEIAAEAIREAARTRVCFSSCNLDVHAISAHSA